MGETKLTPFQVIATINPHKTTKQTVNLLVENGATTFRLNGAHVDVETLASFSKELQRIADKTIKILLDLPGNKIRTQAISQDIHLEKGEAFELSVGNFNFSDFVTWLVRGDVLLCSDGQLQVKVEECLGDRCIFVATNTGTLRNGKGVHLQQRRLDRLPFLSSRDYVLIDEAKKARVDYLGFSFVRRLEDMVEAGHVIAGSDIEPIFKLETREMGDMQTLQGVLGRGDRFLIDRGDLLSEVGLHAFPTTFNQILDAVLTSGKEALIATQLFMSMCNQTLPYISEIIEFHRLLKLGIHGIQLSEETAVGDNPIDVLRIISGFLEAERA